MADSRISYRTLRELVQHALREDILRIRFRPGQRLTEAELAATYGVSRAPIREAVRALEEQGLVRSISNRGIVVSRLSPEEVGEVYEMRAELESLAARFAVPNLDTATLQGLRNLLTKLDVTIDDTKTWLSKHDEFHMTVYRASGRNRLCRQIGELTNVVEPHIRLFLNTPGLLRETHREHHGILAAAEEGDAVGCAELIRKHLRNAGEQIVQLAAREEVV
jgi:DNA-binding GntR family transcriptional regulator